MDRNNIEKLGLIIVAAVLALLYLALAGPVGKLFDMVAGAMGRTHFDRIFSTLEFSTLAVLTLHLGIRIKRTSTLTWTKIVAWTLWAVAVSFAETKNVLLVEHIHYFQYGILGFILWRPCRKNIVLVLLIGGLVGAGDELLQGITKSRVMDWADALYNLLGVLGGGLYAFSIDPSPAQRNPVKKAINVATAIALLTVSLTAHADEEKPRLSIDPLDRPIKFGLSQAEWAASLAGIHNLHELLNVLKKHVESTRGPGIAREYGANLPNPDETVDRAWPSLGTLPRAAAIMEQAGSMMLDWIDANIAEKARSPAIKGALKTFLLSRKKEFLAPMESAGLRSIQPDLYGLMEVLEKILDASDALQSKIEIPGSSTNSGRPNCVSGDVVFAEHTRMGWILIGGKGETRYECRDLFIVLDPGGDDQYRFGPAKCLSGHMGGVSLVVDLGGNDSYASNDIGGPAAGCMSASVIIDMEGDDSYVAGQLGLGAGMYGAGMLVDMGGNDRYVASSAAQAASIGGIGILVDAGGNDTYDVGVFGQAAAALNGLAMLLDLQGDDSYLAGGIVRDFREPNKSWLTYCQGFGFGIREAGFHGGSAILVDASGDDLYRSGYFGQGSGTFHGFGVLADLGGDDKYIARRYVQGCGVHQGTGLLLDGGGDDLFEAFGAAQGCGHDQAAGILMDLGGNDRYDLGWLGQGASRSMGTGVLADLSGKDRYWAGAANTQGSREAGEPLAGPGKCLLLDLGGDDFYTGAGKDGLKWGDPSQGCGGIDSGR